MKKYTKYSNEFLLNHLKELAVKLGRTPYGREIDKAGIVKCGLYYKRFGSLSKAHKLAGLVPTNEIIHQPKYSEYSNEFLLNYLKELAVKLGRTPYYKDFDKAGTVKHIVYFKRFGSLVKAQKAAGLVPYNNRGKVKLQKYSEYSNEFLLNHLKELAVKLGRAPYGREIDKAGIATQWTYFKRFGSLVKAQKAAGLVPTNEIIKQPKYSEYTDEDLLNYLKELSVKLGRAPYGPEIDKAGIVKYWIYYKRFGSLITAQEAAGLVPATKIIKQPKYSEYTDEDLLNYLKELSVKLGRAPYGPEIDKAGIVKYWIYYKRFGSLITAQEAAGLVPATKIIKQPKYSEYTNEDLLNYLKELSVKLDKTPSFRDINKAGIVTYQVYHNRFGSLIAAQEAAGLVPYRERGKVKLQKYSEYSDEYLLNHLKELAVKLGRTPYGWEIDKAGIVKQWVYFKRFGSLITAQEAAGLVPGKKIEKSKYTGEDVLNYLKELSVKLGRTPMIKDVKADGKISASYICRCFRTYKKALEKAGLVPNKRSDYRKSLSKMNGERNSS